MGFNIGAMVDANGALLAIIAINMTVIGLTSLAETKKIIGVDYGKFLIRSYKVLNCIRIYHLLFLFALVNALSLLFMFSANNTIHKINIIVLVFSLIFAIYYFFAYILIENSMLRNSFMS